MSRRAEIFELFAGENVESSKMDLGMSMLACLGGTHFHDFARAAFDHNEAVLPQGRALHRVGGRSAGISTLESMLMLGLWSVEFNQEFKLGYRMREGRIRYMDLLAHRPP